MDRYRRDEGSYDRGDEPEPAGLPADFPWESSTGAHQPSAVWEEGHTEQMGHGALGEVQRGGENPMAIAGFVCSILMWLPIPYLNFVLWLSAVTLSSIGLRRARRFGLRRRGLAIAGLCLSLIGLVLAIIVIAFVVGGLTSLA